MSAQSAIGQSSMRKIATREAALFLGLLLFGLLILPIAVYLVGGTVFGEYGGDGFFAFYGMLHSAIRNGETAVLFLVLSPYLLWQVFRLTVWGFRKTWHRRHGIDD